MILNNGFNTDADDRAFKLAGELITRQQRLNTIAGMHTPDALGRCAACDHPGPCRTWIVAVGGDR